MESCINTPINNKATSTLEVGSLIFSFDSHLDDFTLCVVKHGEVVSTIKNLPASRKALKAQASLLQNGVAVVEGSSTAHPLLWELKRLNVEVGMVNPLKVRNLRRGFFKDCKNDRIDAAASAMVVDRMREKPREPGDTELRILARHLQSLTKRLTQVKLKAWWLLYNLNTNYRKCFDDLFCKASRILLEQYTPQDLEEMSLEELEEALRSAYPRYDSEKARLVKGLLEDGLRGNVGQGGVMVLRDLLRELRDLERRIEETEKYLVRLVEERFGESLKLLQTIPGVSAEQAAVILAELGDVNRFPTVDKVVAFAGLDPKVRESGKWKGKRKLSKKGSPTLRTVLYRTAMGCRFKNPVVNAEYERMRSEGRSYKEALVSSSRKLLKVVYAVLRDRKPFYVPENLPDP